ncbi:ankyrin repeat protein, putative [Trichomonas vaginalis G3]|uniref:Ankyrin repeat protein, putative n=1 Tax=Trichomonas vaginalis (strain ATCC PRA-98 / G3) TaxID=412133 RepID=A2FGV0_TRIV3|nr:ankyrin repeat and SOCS box-containing protein 4 family [Trichomonas vaginalis G3]EAX95854.1 ankyrin repeat protein, putative [Trichomonas vaginalis G3]KAI5488672.1 ankyrin repeat and SOCS box-containing protein 4 family [Trichomonas vaginalis G3]|eukprot:XP_001308784.1 ankyrin repeat protein [Trichomonas vaginalis G3]
MSDQDVHPNKYSELLSICKYDIDTYITLYQLKTENEEELNKIYKMIKKELIDSKKYRPQDIIKDILDIIYYNNRYTKSYLYLAKLISDDYHVNEIEDFKSILNFLFYKEYGIKLDKFDDFEKCKFENLDIHTDDTIYRAIMYNDLERFIYFIENEGFHQNQILICKLYPYTGKGYSLLELCCYHGAVDCFKLLRTKFKSEITQECLQFSFLGRNQEIMSECLKYQVPDNRCMKYAIISHNIDFVTFLMNEYNMPIDLDYCEWHRNIESFLVYFDQTNDLNECFIYSVSFNITSLCEHFLSLGANINEINKHGETALHYAAEKNNKEIAELLISCGANINEKNKYGETVLHYAAEKNNKEMAELLISCGANINEKNKYGETVLHYAAEKNNKEMAELLISCGANINEKNKYGETVLHYAAEKNNKEIAGLFISCGANINKKDNYTKTALHTAAEHNNKETAKLLISSGANINEKGNIGETALHYATRCNNKETVELLISCGANINEKNQYEETALHYATRYCNKEMAELLISLGANINEKNKYEETALHYATMSNNISTVELLISHGATTY